MNLTRQSRKKVRLFELTPMVDVVFQLIIFFMLTSQFGELTRTEVDLPREPGVQDAVRQAPDLVVDVLLDGRYQIDGEDITLEGVAELARTLAGDRGGIGELAVQVRPDREASVTAMNALVRRLSGLGVQRMALGVVEPAGLERGGGDS